MVVGEVRRLISERKSLKSLSDWSDKETPPRYTPFAKSMRLPSKCWKWRVAECETALAREYVILARVNYRMGNYQAWLLHKSKGDLALIARLEDHASHKGLHVHSACGDDIPLPGTASIRLKPDGKTKLNRVPDAKSFMRRSVQGSTLEAFWCLSMATFRVVSEMEGGVDQLELF